jgi:CRP/FNR family cyclic AMP-dependent transcriptional regulator
MKLQEIEAVLQDSRFFKGLDDNVIRKVAAIGEAVSLKGGEYVFRQGDFGEKIYIIVEGYVLLERATNLGDRQGRVVIDALGRGRFLGCWSTLLAEPHILMSSASCQKPTTVISIEGADLRAIMLDDFEIGFRVMERLSFLLRDRIKAAYGAMEKV